MSSSLSACEVVVIQVELDLERTVRHPSTPPQEVQDLF